MAIKISLKTISENIGPRVEKLVLNSVLNFRLKLEMQVSDNGHYNQSNPRTNI